MFRVGGVKILNVSLGKQSSSRRTAIGHFLLRRSWWYLLDQERMDWKSEDLNVDLGFIWNRL